MTGILRYAMTLAVMTSFVTGLSTSRAGAQESAVPGAEKLGPGVLEALQKEGQAHVMVALQPPIAATRSLSDLRLRIDEAQQAVLSDLGPSDYITRYTYRAVPAFAGTLLNESTLEKILAHPGVARIDLDLGGTGTLATSVPLIRADKWHNLGFTGTNHVVAVLDTGIDTDHSDLSDNLIAEACFLDFDGMIDGVGRCPDGSDRQMGAGAAEDGAGHGTATSGIITSAGTISSVGVAPDADIVAIKVLDNTGFAGTFAFFSEIVAALDFIINNRPDVEVINMSLGTNALFTGDCDNASAATMAGASAINTLRANGVTAFASSGNDSSGTQMALPACLSNVISVGATDFNDVVAGFTDSNSSTDLMAPGVNITSTGIGDTTVAGLNGTSFASPHAAGCAVLLIDSGTATTPNTIETYLESSPVLVTDAKNNLTFPRLQCFPNNPPVADAGMDQTVECASPTGTMVTLDGSGSMDPDDDELTFTWTEGAVTLAGPTTDAQVQVSLAFGVHVITLTVDDGFGETDTDDVVITLEDTTPPVVTLNGDSEITLECSLDDYVELGATATDACEGALTVDISGVVDAATPGDYEVVYTAEDSSGNQAMETRTIHVEDTTPPEIMVNAAPASFWPPNHKYNTVALSELGLAVADACDMTLSANDVLIAATTSDEPENGNGDGNTLADIVIAPTCRAVSLRSERAGGLNGRVYTLGLHVADSSGNVGTASYQAHVPKSQALGPFAIDDGPSYSVDGCPVPGDP